jgi:membrane protease subunit HflC
MDADPEDYLTKEKKTLRVDSFVKWRVRNVSEYWNKVQGDPTRAENRLRQRVNKSLRDEFGNRDVKDVISGDRAKIMDIVKNTVDEEAKDIGVEVVDVRLKRVDLDPNISERVYDRMKAERTRIATQLRAQGAEAAQRIRANADRQSQIILAEADRDAETLRGEGDAEATMIYATAFGADREFYNLYRSLNAYKQTFRDKSDLIILEPDSDFFKYFNQSQVKSSPPTATADSK